MSRRELYIAALAAVGILIDLILRLLTVATAMRLIPLLLVLTLGGPPLVWRLTSNLVRLRLGSDLLACIIVLMLAGGQTLEEYATGKASAALEALANRMPRKTHRRGAAGIEDIDTGAIKAGDILIAFPHKLRPVDGTVAEGGGSMDESFLTGEPFLISKAPGSAVISGAVNGDRAMTIAAERLPVELALRADHARDAGVATEQTQNAPARGPSGILVHSAGSSDCDCRGRLERARGPIPGSDGNRHALPITDRNSSGCDWCNFTVRASGDRDLRPRHSKAGGPV